jgi:hypothetical protein
LLERNATGIVMAVCLLFSGLAVKLCVALPTSRDKVLAGVSVMMAGTGKTVLVVGPLLLQLVKAATKPTTKMNANRTIADDLPMHPPRPLNPRGELVWTLSGKPQV